MPHDRGRGRAGGAGGRRRRRAIAGGVAVAATTAVGGWAAPAHAGTVAPSAHADCTYDDYFQRSEILLRLADFPPSEPLRSVIVIKGRNDGSRQDYGFEYDTPTYGDGSWTAPAPSFYDELPVHIGWIVYRDTNANYHYDNKADDTLFNGAGDVTTCPSSVTLSSK
jgi:hypothetical protein